MHSMLKEILEEETLPGRYMEMSQESLDASSLIRSRSAVMAMGNGTSYNAALYLSILLLRTGKMCLPMYSSEVISGLSPDWKGRDTVSVIFSQSGETVDALSAASFLRDRMSSIVSVTNVAGSSLARISDISLTTRCGEERAVAATKSHFSQLLEAIWLSHSGNQAFLTDLMKRTADDVGTVLRSRSQLDDMARAIGSRVVFLGSGLLYPVAREAALKMKETSAIVTDAYPTREFLHGPKQILDDGWSVFLLSSDDHVRGEIERYCKNVHDLTDIARNVLGIVPFSDLEDSLVKLTLLQILSYFKAVSVGMDPDSPSKLSKVVEK